MFAAVGCAEETFWYATVSNQQRVIDAGKRLGLQTILAAMQVVDHTLGRLKFSTQGRILAELALVQICALEDLDELPSMIAAVQSDDAAAGCGSSRATAGGVSASKAVERDQAPGSPSSGANQTTPSGDSALAVSGDSAAEIWARAVQKTSGMVAEQARQYDKVSFTAPNRLVIRFKPGYAFAKSFCEQPDQAKRLEQALTEVTGEAITVDFVLDEEDVSGLGVSAEAASRSSPQQRLLEVANHPLIRRAGELFGAQPTQVDDPPEQE
jgi:DNA polymerase-3 subunit gamma/tau